MLFAIIYVSVMTFICTKIVEMVPTEGKRK